MLLGRGRRFERGHSTHRCRPKLRQGRSLAREGAILRKTFVGVTRRSRGRLDRYSAAVQEHWLDLPKYFRSLGLSARIFDIPNARRSIAWCPVIL